MSVNKVILVGRLGGDPELRFTPNGRAVCNFQLALESVWKDREGQRQKSVEWAKIVIWGKTAETAAKYLSKGREAYIEGEMKTRNYEDKEGVKRYVTEVIARDVRFLGGGNGQRRDEGVPDAAGDAYDEPMPAPASSGPEEDDDSVPF